MEEFEPEIKASVSSASEDIVEERADDSESNDTISISPKAPGNQQWEGTPSTENCPKEAIIQDISQNEDVKESGNEKNEVENFNSSVLAENGTPEEPKELTEPETTENASVPESDASKSSAKLPLGYSIQKLSIDISLESSEFISAVEAHGPNLYVGSSRGQLFHLYLFEDAEDYIVISQLTIGSSIKGPITKILLLEDVEMCLLLSNKVLYSYLLPELSPCNVGKLRDVEDILMLRQVKNSKIKSKLDKVVAFTSTRIRLFQFFKDSIKLLKDIPYAGTLIGLSSAAGTLLNYSNICLVANGSNYEVVEIQQTRRIPLSEYNPSQVEFIHTEQKVEPHIIPFQALDKLHEPEEYLLSICSDSSTSMALFVNSEGDVTRGTLLWLQEGYPTGGLAVEWPYLIGSFWNDSDKICRLCIASLESLDSVFTADMSTLLEENVFLNGSVAVKKVSNGFLVLDRELLDFLQLVNCTDRKPVQSSKKYKTASVALISGCSYTFLDKKSSLSSTLELILEKLRSPNQQSYIPECCKELAQTVPSDDALWPVYISLLLLAGQEKEVKLLIQKQHLTKRKIDPRLLLLFCDDVMDKNSPFWAEFSVPQLVLDLLDLQKERFHHEFRTWIIEEFYNNKDSYSAETNDAIRNYMYTEAGKSTDALVQLIDSERDLWVAQNPTSDALLEFFSNQQLFLLVLHVYLLKQLGGNQFRQWGLLIIELGLDLLSGRKTLNSSDTEYQKQHPIDLVNAVFFQLYDRIDEEEVFTKNLLELLKLQPDEGLTLLKKNKGGKFESCNKAILSELSKSIKMDHQFVLLKIEYAEQAFFNAIRTNRDYILQAQDLVQELSNYLMEEECDDEFQNLMILYQTYQVENNLCDSTWPKLTWVEFLGINRGNSECKDLAQVYLKFYEVLVFMYGSGKSPEFQLNRLEPVTEYLIQMKKPHELIMFLLELCDYSTAEWVACHGFYPPPRQSIYPDSLLGKFSNKGQVETQTLYNNVKQILDFYLTVEDTTSKHAAVKHFLNHIGGEVLTISEVLEIIPDSFPLWCLDKFLTEELITLKQKQASSASRKVLARLDARFSKALLVDFTTKHGDI